MKPEREGKGHGEGKGITPWNISETVLYGKGMSGVLAGQRWKKDMFAPNVTAVKGTGWKMDGINALNAAIRFL